MHQVATAVWNEIAETEKLATPWAQQMFPLPPEDLDLALSREEERLAKELEGDYLLAAVYLKVMPLLWENRAISRFKERNPDPFGALPEILTVDEAVILASREVSLTRSQQLQLASLLRELPV